MSMISYLAICSRLVTLNFYTVKLFSRLWLDVGNPIAKKFPFTVGKLSRP